MDYHATNSPSLPFWRNWRWSIQQRNAPDGQSGLAVAVGARAVLSARARIGLLAGFALLVVLRLWHAFRVGRFFCEESAVFFAYAWHRPAWDALWRPFAGYLNLAANGFALIDARLVQAGIVSLENAPRVTMTVAWAFQLLPAILLLQGRGRWLADRRAVIASLLMIVLSPMTEEVWLNILHIQFQLILCCGLILALDAPRGWAGRIASWLILAAAPLCGPGAVAFLPLFAVRSALERDSRRLAQALALLAGSLAQLLVFFSPSPVRGSFIGVPALASMLFVRLGLLPFFGRKVANAFGKMAMHQFLVAGPGWWAITALGLMFCVGLGLLAFLYRRDAAGWLIAGGLVIAAISFGGGMIAVGPATWFSVGAAERYNFVPLALMGIGLVAIAARHPGRSGQIMTWLIGWILLVAAIGYPAPIKDVKQGPDWSAQVALWRHNHEYQPLTWPSNWTVDLSDRSRPCPKPALATASLADPSYCESAWLAHVIPTMRK